MNVVPLHQTEISPITLFLHLRHSARRHHAHMSMLNEVCRSVERNRKYFAALVKTIPFYAAKLAKIDADLAQIKEVRKGMRALGVQLGQALVEVADAVDAVTSLDQRLELLNCNVADRGAVRAEAPDSHGMVYLMSAYCVEDSAEHRRDQWNDRPLHTVVNAFIHDRMFNTPEGRKATDRLFNELFAPGGMFEGVRRGTVGADGQLILDPPRLVVHQGGARAAVGTEGTA